jgi:hypothetical protein
LKKFIVEGYRVEASWNGTSWRHDLEYQKHLAKELKDHIEQLVGVSAQVLTDGHTECSYCGEEWKKENLIYNRKRHEYVPWCCNNANREFCDFSFDSNFADALAFLLLDGHTMMVN